MSGDALVAVLSLYAADAFKDDTGRLLQMIAPHVATCIAAAAAAPAPSDARVPADKAPAGAAAALRLVAVR